MSFIIQSGLSDHSAQDAPSVASLEADLGIKGDSLSEESGSVSISNMAKHTTGVQTGKAQTQFYQAALFKQSEAARRLATLLNHRSERARGA